MTADKLKVTLGNHKWSLLVGMLMVVMTVFGYKLARFTDAGDALTVAAQEKTIAVLVKENNELTTRANQLDIALQLAKQEKEIFSNALKKAQNEQDALLEKVAFYERVMAPEKSQDGFVIEGVEVQPLPDSNLYELHLVVLQQRQNKSVLNGKLMVRVRGIQNGEQREIGIGDADFIDEPLAYRFKYFQAITAVFTLPDTFTPHSIDFDTTVFQYKTRKGDYSKTVLWDEAFNSSLSNDLVSTK